MQHKPTSQPASQPVNQPTNQPTDRPTNRPTKPSPTCRGGHPRPSTRTICAHAPTPLWAPKQRFHLCARAHSRACMHVCGCGALVDRSRTSLCRAPRGLLVPVGGHSSSQPTFCERRGLVGYPECMLESERMHGAACWRMRLLVLRSTCRDIPACGAAC